MAVFVKKGSKGAVGHLTAAEGVSGILTVKDGPVDNTDLSLLSQEIPTELDALTEAIKVSHKAALGQMGRAIIIAARAGQLLLAAKKALPKGGKSFTVWLAETFEFSQRTAYNYIEVKERMDSHPAEIAGCESIRDVLKLCDEPDKVKKAKKDVKRPSFVTLAAAIERYFADEEAISPIEDWTPERKETTANMLDGVVRIAARLRA